MITLVTFTSVQGLGKTETLGTAGQSNSGEIASITGYFQTWTTSKGMEYNNYGFASSTSSLEETIQVCGEKNWPLFLKIKSFRLPMQECKESDHQLSAFLRIWDQEHFTHYKSWFLLQDTGNYEHLPVTERAETQKVEVTPHQKITAETTYNCLFFSPTALWMPTLLNQNPTTSFSLHVTNWDRNKTPRVADMLFTALSAFFLQGSLCNCC